MNDLVKSVLILLAVSLISPPTVSAATDRYPSKTVRWIVPASAGGPMDYVARRIARKLSEHWHQSVVVENRAGAAGIIAAQFVADAAADGYTLLHAHNGMISSNPVVYSKLPYHPVKSFEPITHVFSVPAIVMVNLEAPVKTLKELINLAKAKPGSLAYGSSGPGSPQHISGEMFKKLIGVDFQHVAYKGSAPLVTDLLAGHIQVGFEYPVPAGEYAKAGKLRALAIAGPKRLALRPDVPTAAEAGLPEFESIAWAGLLAPARTPPDVIRKIHDAVVTILESPDEQRNAAREGVDLRGMAQEEFREFIKTDMVKGGKAAKDSGAKIE